MLKQTLVFLVALSVVVVAGAAAYQFIGRQEGAEAESGLALARPVPVAEARLAPRAVVREFPGKVRADRRVDLAFSVGGHLLELNGQEGARVAAGETVARLDPRDFQNALDAAKARCEEAEAALARIRALYEQQAAARSELDAREAAYKTAAADLRIRRKALEDATLTAPFDGVVAKRYVENHEHVAPQMPIVSLQDISVVEVAIQAPESLVARSGAEADRSYAVRFEAEGEEWFDARLREFSVEADPVTRTYEIVLALEPPEDLHVFPGMTAMVRLKTESAAPLGAGSGDGAVLIPVEALAADPSGNAFVWVIEGDGKPPRRVAVTTGAMREASVEILSGLKAGQTVATAGLHSLDEERPVRPMREGREGLDG